MASADALNGKRESQTLIEAFRKFDKDTDHTIEYEELLQVRACGACIVRTFTV